MIARRVMVGLCLLAFASGALALVGSDAAQAQEKKKEKSPLEGKKGTVVGTLVGKEKNAIEVKADGEEKGRKYVPQWKGGAPAQGGGPDKAMLKIFNELKVGSRIEVEWLFEERLRAISVKVLKTPEKDK